jgi:hypothetical protein
MNQGPISTTPVKVKHESRAQSKSCMLATSVPESQDTQKSNRVPADGRMIDHVATSKRTKGKTFCRIPYSSV